VELMIRELEAREGMTRPSMRMIGHTAYLVFARKVEKIHERTQQIAKKEEEDEEAVGEGEGEEEEKEDGDKEVS